jgi:energy-coupling factor transporter ATP-binding protein EcfA2
VILGSNGSGKTRLIQHLMHTRTVKSAPYLYIEGARQVREALNSMRIESSTFGDFGTPEKAEHTYRAHRGGELTARISRSLLTLKQRSEKELRDYYDAMAIWAESDRSKPCPLKPETSFQTVLRLFKSIFPHLDVTLTPQDQLHISQGNSGAYVISAASEGERQVFALLSDVILNVEPGVLILVDEPEVHLHPSLACQAWDVLEAHLPEAQFLYATHSISFAMRPNVKSLFVMDREKNAPRRLERLDEISEEERHALLGNIPGIITARKALAVEGLEDSFDRAFYQWLIGPAAKVVPLGSRRDVHGQAARLTLWRSLAPGCDIAAFVDRDYTQDASLSKSETDSFHVLPLHEAESFLCLPRLIADLHRALYRTEWHCEEIVSVMTSFANDNLLKVVARRVTAAIGNGQSVSIPNSAMISVESAEKLVALLSQMSETKSKALQQAALDMQSVVQAEVRRCRLAIDQKNINEILKLFPGKELLEKFVTKLGLSSSVYLVAAASSHLKPGDYPEIASLQALLRHSLKIDA